MLVSSEFRFENRIYPANESLFLEKSDLIKVCVFHFDDHHLFI